MRAPSRFIGPNPSPAYPQQLTTEAELQAAEELLGVRFPDDYRRAVLVTGLPATPDALRDALDEMDDSWCDVDTLFMPGEVVSITTDYRSGGMPSQLIAFCYDSGGNTFCFDEDRLCAGTDDAGTVWFFDHDFNKVSAIAPSFDAWLGMFIAA